MKFAFTHKRSSFGFDINLNNFYRFAPTRPPTHWSGVYAATSYGSVCPQKFPETSNMTEALLTMSQRRLDYLRNVRIRLNKQSEDCLNLNIYIPHAGSAGSDSRDRADQNQQDGKGEKNQDQCQQNYMHTKPIV